MMISHSSYFVLKVGFCMYTTRQQIDGYETPAVLPI